MHSPSSGTQEVWVSLGPILGPAEPQRWSCPWAPSDWWLSSHGASEAAGSALEKGVCTTPGVGASVAPSTTRRMRGSLCWSAASTCLGASRSGLLWGASRKMRSQCSWVPRTVSPGPSSGLYIQPSPSGRQGAPFPRLCSVGAESRGVRRVCAPAPSTCVLGQGPRSPATCGPAPSLQPLLGHRAQSELLGASLPKPTSVRTRRPPVRWGLGQAPWPGSDSYSGLLV